MKRAIRAEWTKQRTVPATAWTLAALVLTTMAFSTLTIAVTRSVDCQGPCDLDLVRLSLSGTILGQTPAVVLAVLAIGSEYDNRLIDTTLTAQPHRATVIAAKITVTTTLVGTATAFALAWCWTTTRIVLTAKGLDTFNQATSSATLRAYTGTIAYLMLLTLLTIGITLITRSSPAGLSITLTLLYIGPVLAQLVTNETWRRQIQRLAPMNAGMAIQTTRNTDQLPIDPLVGLAVLAAYSVLTLTVGTITFLHRDTSSRQ